MGAFSSRQHGEHRRVGGRFQLQSLQQQRRFQRDGLLFLPASVHHASASGDKYLTGFLPSGTTSPGGSSDPLAVYAKISGSGYQLGIRKTGASTTYASTVLALNINYLVVVKYVFGPGSSDDTVCLYIGPTAGQAEPAPDVTLTGGTDAANLQNVYLKSSSGYGTWNFDTLRVGPAWADVTPTSTPPPRQLSPTSPRR